MNHSTSENAFETALTQTLLERGYTHLAPPSYDRDRAIFPETVLGFIQATQPQTWARLETLHGDKTGERILSDLSQWLDIHGSLATLRHGFKCYGRTLRLAYFKAAHNLNPELEARYQANVVGLTRQLHYSNRHEKSLDVVLSVGGIPLVTLELKNPLTGQTFEDAIKQYRKDRDPREKVLEFGKRTLIHFALDTEATRMTTRLAGSTTQFLPFDKGHNKGAGNPPDLLGRDYRTAYVWEETLERSSLLDLLGRFLHLQTEERISDEGRKVRRETLIFPRYHQLETVRKLEAAATLEGPGHNYLIEHSAGSGKSNTLGWLAHRLASLHNHQDNRVFDSVIVVTDRRVLDKQLQDTIYQFEHRQGVVQRIDTDSKQLTQALESGVPIIITTLQKFPFVSRHLLKQAEERGESAESGAGLLASRRYAVIIDEAHSSQSGETATDLKEVLGGEDLRERAKQQAEEEEQPQLEALYRQMAARGQQTNISFFAFTATPKPKTLMVFGRENNSVYSYTMRQAIEEGFILDVLQNYTTYKAYYRLLQETERDPNVERKPAARELARFFRLHPSNIEQKTEIMVEHFYHFTRHKIGERAKAMVVTASRLEAVRYKQSFDRYIAKKGYGDKMRTLVAFSGKVEDPDVLGVSYSETVMNGGLAESALPERFAEKDMQILLVAEKYQTGFDQPLLHTLYINRRLGGIQAVQTLSRLNRTHPLKEDTFVLDFINEREDIAAAFQSYYEGATLGDEPEPQRLYELKAQLDKSGIYTMLELEGFCEVYFRGKNKLNPNDHRQLNALIDPAVDRFKALETSSIEEADLWRDQLTAYRSLYGLLSQIIPYQDSDLEKLYVYLRFLALKLPRRGSGIDYQFDDTVQLEYYRLQKVSEGSIVLEKDKIATLSGPLELGSGTLKDEEKVKLSKLIQIINDRFGTDFNEADQLFFDQIIEAALEVPSLKQAAEVNSVSKFKLVFRQVLESLFIERMSLNEELFSRFMGEADFQKIVSEWLGEQVYAKLPKRTTV
jgi:type I restriction enzyme, R subunit